MPPALRAVISLSPDRRPIESRVPNSIAIGITSSKNDGICQRTYSIAIHSERFSCETSRPIASSWVATKISVNASAPISAGPASSATR